LSTVATSPECSQPSRIVSAVGLGSLSVLLHDVRAAMITSPCLARADVVSLSSTTRTSV